MFRVGDLSSATTDDGRHTDIRIEKIISHPKYSNSTKNNDIALLKLASPAPYGQHVQPICLPGQNEDVPIGTDCFITGIEPGALHYWFIWGFTFLPNPRKNAGFGDPILEYESGFR
eukprot:Seg1361.4 transcript_id=Seg1361.4/GoldUCD/mRNA.D3Y31 product="Chymotrypsinogen B2" protein_id=Seg1361.4/GoldUCD/D3Y31